MKMGLRWFAQLISNNKRKWSRIEKKKREQEEHKQWTKEEWKRQQGCKMRDRLLDPKKMLQVTRPGMYWFTDLNGKKWFVQITDQDILDPKQATMLEVDTTIIKYVDSIGVGEFVGPITHHCQDTNNR